MVTLIRYYKDIIWALFIALVIYLFIVAIVATVALIEAVTLIYWLVMVGL